ncbi:hypothetical protein O7635_07610 [Asanoa sp. WMMD1127]|uniref:hypothetical protein n=1 Tax=Asanoa sp. WMMD1127 TaxID=3016107 RepID=UPI002417697C|nr:hypothetical protein [Asanoa sp. WMMD1127]MDG4821718.1 hypothetical protein [Asanoa sp. WMMD1127]
MSLEAKVIIAAIAFVVAFAGSVLANFIRRPRWLTNRRLFATVGIVMVLTVGLAVIPDERNNVDTSMRPSIAPTTENPQPATPALVREVEDPSGQLGEIEVARDGPVDKAWMEEIEEIRSFFNQHPAQVVKLKLNFVPASGGKNVKVSLTEGETGLAGIELNSHCEEQDPGWDCIILRLVLLKGSASYLGYDQVRYVNASLDGFFRVGRTVNQTGTTIVEIMPVEPPEGEVLAPRDDSSPR